MTEAEFAEAMLKLKELAQVIKKTKLSDTTYDELEHAFAKIRSNLAFEVMGLNN